MDLIVWVWIAVGLSSTVLLVPATRRRGTYLAPFRAIGGWLRRRRELSLYRRQIAERTEEMRPVRQPQQGVAITPLASGKPRCIHCGGSMESARQTHHSIVGQLFGVVVFLLGVLLCICIPVIGWVLGPIICLAALFMGYRTSKVWRCTNCRAIVPRG